MDEKTSEKNQSTNSQQTIKPSDIEGKIEVTDKRERKDGPGGN